jgi:hypothetical protein
MLEMRVQMSRFPKYPEGDLSVIPFAYGLHKLVGANRTLNFSMFTHTLKFIYNYYHILFHLLDYYVFAVDPQHKI